MAVRPVLVWISLTCALALSSVLGAGEDKSDSKPARQTGSNLKGSKPTISTRYSHTDRLVHAGRGTTLFCRDRGKPKPRIHWYYNGQLLHLPDNPRMMIMPEALRIIPAHKNDSGIYACKAENQYGVAWLNFTLTVVAPHEEEEKWTAGRRRNITKVEDQRMPHMYHHDRSTRVHPWARPKRHTPLKKHRKHNKKNHGNPEGPPRWNRRKRDHILFAKPAGDMVELKCHAKGFPTPNITWYKDGKLFIHRTLGNIIRKKYMIRLEDLTTEDSGNYTCVVFNKHGSIEWTYVLDVIERYPHKPIIDPINNVTVPLGGLAEFECIFISEPHPFVQWVKHYKVNGSDMDAKGVPYFNKIQPSDEDRPEKLVVEKVTEDDVGKYTCVVGSSLGHSYRSAWLILESPAPSASTSTSTSYLPTIIMLIILTLRWTHGKTGQN